MTGFCLILRGGIQERCLFMSCFMMIIEGGVVCFIYFFCFISFILGFITLRFLVLCDGCFFFGGLRIDLLGRR